MAEASTRLRLRVSPGARRSELAGRHGDGWKVRVVRMDGLRVDTVELTGPRDTGGDS